MTLRCRFFSNRQLIRVYAGSIDDIKPVIIKTHLPKHECLLQVLVDENLDYNTTKRTELGVCWLEYDHKTGKHLGTCKEISIRADDFQCYFSDMFYSTDTNQTFLLTPPPPTQPLLPIL